jgi:hypothetical protein
MKTARGESDNVCGAEGEGAGREREGEGEGERERGRGKGGIGGKDRQGQIDSIE